VGAGAATLTELETTWGLDDMLRANAMLDMKDDVEAAIAESIGK
jgi:hypothetical protein